MPSPETKEKTCKDCQYCFSQDTGYSNYTVEGTEFTCLNGTHPNKEGFDEFYGEAPELKYAQQCEHFTPGAGIRIDVEGDDWADVTEAQKELLKRYRLIRLINDGRDIHMPESVLA